MGEYTDKTKGQIKKATGKLTGNEGLEREGKRDEAKGRAKGAVQDAKDRSRKAEKSIKERDKHHDRDSTAGREKRR